MRLFKYAICAFLSVCLFGCAEERILPNVNMSSFYGLSSFDSYDNNPDTFVKFGYDWYKSIEKRDDVYLVKSRYFSEDTLEGLTPAGSYSVVPDRAFWLMTVSPSYVGYVNFKVDEASLVKASEGVRMYALPDTLTEEQCEQMKAFLEEDANKYADYPIISTTFTTDRTVEFTTYHPDDTYFTWPENRNEDFSCKDPVLCICTCKNMNRMESEHLMDIGINGLVKLDGSKAVKMYCGDVMVDRSGDFRLFSELYESAVKDGMCAEGIEEYFQ